MRVSFIVIFLFFTMRVFSQPDNTKHGKKEGVHTSWYDNGVKEKEEVFTDNKKNGICRYWNKKGILVKEIKYSLNIPNGIYRTWTEDGKPLTDYHYTMHVRNGQCKRWDSTGKMVLNREYKMGYPVNFFLPIVPKVKKDCLPNSFTPFTQCDSIIQLYRQDALAIAYRMAQDTLSPYYDSILIPKHLINTIHVALIALHNHSLFGIHVYHPYSKQLNKAEMAIMLEGSPVWNTHWKNGKEETGIISIDTIISQYALKLQKKKYDSFPGSDFFYFESTYIINYHALSKRLNQIDKRILVWKLYLEIGDGNDIFYERKENCTKITLSVGGGDCPAGCLVRFNNIYHVYDDGEVDYIETNKRIPGSSTSSYDE